VAEQQFGHVDICTTVKGLVSGQQQQGARNALRKRTGREYLIVCLWDYASYLNVYSTLLRWFRHILRYTRVSQHNRGGVEWEIAGALLWYR
jgi:hypothetical protein